MLLLEKVGDLNWHQFCQLLQNDNLKLYNYLKTVKAEISDNGIKFSGSNKDKFFFFLYKDTLQKKLKEAGFTGVVTWQS